MIYRPSHFDESKSYPVIENIYAGPHSSHAPKTFRANRSDQALAELEFVVVQMDGMGTANRSKAFHDVCWQNVGDAGCGPYRGRRLRRTRRRDFFVMRLLSENPPDWNTMKLEK